MPQDLLATVYHLLGVPPDTEIRGRPPAGRCRSRAAR
jgi:hypothetical protein